MKKIAMNYYYRKRITDVYILKTYLSYVELQNRVKEKKIQNKRLRKQIEIFIIETNTKPPKKYYATNKTNVFYIDNVWSLDILDLKDHGAENNKSYRYVLVVIENFSKFGRFLSETRMLKQ